MIPLAQLGNGMLSRKENKPTTTAGNNMEESHILSGRDRLNRAHSAQSTLYSYKDTPS